MILFMTVATRIAVRKPRASGDDPSSAVISPFSIA